MKTFKHFYQHQYNRFISAISILCCCILLCLNSTEVAAQLGKNTYDFQPFLTQNRTLIQNKHLSRSDLNMGVSYQRFLTKKILLGAGLAYSNNLILLPSAFDFFYERQHRYYFSHQIRFYLNKKGPWYFFLGMQNQYRFSRSTAWSMGSRDPFLTEDDPDLDQHQYLSYICLGLNKALDENVFWELKLQSDLPGIEAEPFSKGLSINNNFKLFFNQPWRLKTDSLEQRFLRASNKLISGEANLFFSYEIEDYRLIDLNTEIEVFLSDRWMLSSKLLLSNVNQTFADFSLALTTSVFANLAPQFYLRPIWGLGYDLNNGSFSMNLPAGLELNYFSPQARWYQGYQFVLRNTNHGANHYSRPNQFTIYGGVDYFVLPNVFVRGNINVQMESFRLFGESDADGFFHPDSYKLFIPEVGVHLML